MKTKTTYSSRPGGVHHKNPLDILIALAFFAGTPLWFGEEVLPFAPPKPAKLSCSNKAEEK